MISRTLLAIAMVAISFGSANAVTYYASQGERSNGNAVAAEYRNIDNVHDGNADTYFSLGVYGTEVGYGGSLTADVRPLRIASGSVIEVTNSTPNTKYPESAEIWLGGSVVDGVWSSEGAVLFGEIFNQDPAKRDFTFKSELGTIKMTNKGGRETGW